MKTRIIITERQYQEIFLKQKNNILLKEQLLNKLGREIGDFIINKIDKDNIFKQIKNIEKEISQTTKSSTKIELNKKLERLKNHVKSGEAIKELIPNIDNIKKILNVTNIDTIDDIKNAFLSKNFTKEDIEELYNIGNFKNIVLTIFTEDKEIKKLFSFYNTLKNKVKPNHPDLIKIKQIIDKQIPKELKNDISQTIKTKIEKEEIKAAKKGSADELETSLPTSVAEEFGIDAIKLKTMLFRLDELEDLVTIVRKHKEKIDEISSTYIKMFSKKDKEIWDKIIYDLEKNGGKKIKSNIEELKYYISKNDINLDDFLKRISTLTPSLPFKKLMLKIGKIIGFNVAGIIYYLGLLLFWGSTILYTLYKIDTTTKPKSDNSLEGFISFIEAGLKSDPEKLKLFKDLFNDKKIELKLDSTDKTKWFIIDKEGEFTGEKKILTYKWDGNTFKRIDKQKFENSLAGFTTWYTTPVENGGNGKEISDDIVIKGTKDLFIINIKSEDDSLEEGPSYEFIDGTFRYKKKIQNEI